jgi:hypothetical protein
MNQEAEDEIPMIDVDDWTAINPQHLLDELHLIKESDWPGSKGFYSTYKVYSSLNVSQLGKMKAYFTSLKEDTKLKVIILFIISLNLLTFNS